MMRAEYCLFHNQNAYYRLIANSIVISPSILVHLPNKFSFSRTYLTRVFNGNRRNLTIVVCKAKIKCNDKSYRKVQSIAENLEPFREQIPENKFSVIYRNELTYLLYMSINIASCTGFRLHETCIQLRKLIYILSIHW